MHISVNGEPRIIEPGTTVADLLADTPNRGIAVAVNGEVVPRGDHSGRVLTEGALVEIVTAVQGG